MKQTCTASATNPEYFEEHFYMQKAIMYVMAVHNKF